MSVLDLPKSEKKHSVWRTSSEVRSQ